MSFRPRKQQTVDNSSIEFKEGLVSTTSAPDDTLAILKQELSELKSKMGSNTLNNETFTPTNGHLLKHPPTHKHMGKHVSKHVHPSKNMHRSMQNNIAIHTDKNLPVTTKLQSSIVATNTGESLDELQNSVMSKLEKLEAKLHDSTKTKMQVNNHCIINSVFDKLNALESKIQTLQPTKCETPYLQNQVTSLQSQVMNKIEALESKMRTSTSLDTKSETPCLQSQVMKKIEALESKMRTGTSLDTSMPAFTYKDYVNEKSKLNELMKMRSEIY